MVRPAGNLDGMHAAPRIDLGRYDQSWYSRGRSAIVIVLWEIIQRTAIQGSLHPMYGWRRFWYRLFGAKIGKAVHIRRTVTCNYPWKVSIGDRSWIGDDAVLYALDDITIGSDAVISQRAYLCTGSHDHTDPAFGLKTAPIRIGDGAWIAIDGLVLPGVTVGTGAVLGAKSLLIKDAEPWTIYVGQPARAIGPRTLRECG